MLRRHHCDDAIAAEFPRLHRIVANSPFDESECEARIEDSLDDFLGVADLQIETHLRISDVEGRYEGRQQVGADRVARADRELATFEIREFAHRALCRLVEPEDARGIVQEHLTPWYSLGGDNLRSTDNLRSADIDHKYIVNNVT